MGEKSLAMKREEGGKRGGGEEKVGANRADGGSMTRKGGGR